MMGEMNAKLPAFGAADIRCARRGCKWRGKETELAEVPHKKWSNAMQKTCPACGHDSYRFVKEGRAK